MYLSLLRFKMGFLSSGLFLTLQLNDLAEGAREYRRVGYRHLSAVHEANFYLYECWLSQRASSGTSAASNLKPTIHYSEQLDAMETRLSMLALQGSTKKTGR
jgi:hypothetical protein